MDEKTMLILKGQSIIMEMLLSMMPNYLADSWIDDVNEHSQAIVDLLRKAGYDVKKRESKEDTKE